MALVTNSLEALYGGVNQQAAEHRLNTQVEEMVNAYPTLDRGLLKRNPTAPLTLSSSITYDSAMWKYQYDRGLSGEASEQYSIQITNNGMEIVNVGTGDVYTNGAGITFEGLSSDYLFPFAGSTGYAATTVKDTTFIVNKSRTPQIDQLSSGDSTTTPTSLTLYYSLTPFIKTPTPVWVEESGLPTSLDMHRVMFDMNYYYPSKNMAPTLGQVIVSELYGSGDLFGYSAEVWAYGSSTEVIVDGISIIVTTPKRMLARYDNVQDMVELYGYESLTDWQARVEREVRLALNPTLYKVERADDPNATTPSSFPPLRIIRYDEAPVTVSTTVTPTALESISSLSIKGAALTTTASDYVTQPPTTGTWVTTETAPTSTYLSDGFIWISRSDPVSGYTYTYSLLDASLNTISGSVTGTTTTAVAAALVTSINTHASNGGNFTAVASGSVVKITANNALMSRIDAGDSYGNQASYGWVGEVITADDLPKNLGFEGTLVKVLGSSTNSFSAYWLEYRDAQWRESSDPTLYGSILAESMPHILIRNSDDTFTVKPYDGWTSRLVGDDNTNPVPSFLSVVDNPSPTIKDVFFFKNRLGFITSQTVVMSEVGEYGNFWRTTVVAVLDSDPIDTSVDTTKAINLEYATYLENSVMLFSDKSQFRLSGGQILSPKSVQISQTSAYEINTRVRPLFMNDRIFFIAKRGGYSAVMEYFISQQVDKSEANDITAHVQSYIDDGIVELSGSAINNMLFLVSSKSLDTIYVYKYYDSGNTRVQSAWFKWTFNGSVYGAFSFGKKLNLLIARKDAKAQENWVVGSGIWNGSKLWDNSKLWIGDPSSLVTTNAFEQCAIFPQSYTEEFLDAGTTLIPVEVSIGEWVFKINGKSDIRGHLQFKTVQISSETDSSFELVINDVNRNTERVVNSTYTVNRKPMVYGDAKNMRIGIRNSDSQGFRINTVSYEGNINRRSRGL